MPLSRVLQPCEMARLNLGSGLIDPAGLRFNRLLAAADPQK